MIMTVIKDNSVTPEFELDVLHAQHRSAALLSSAAERCRYGEESIDKII